MGSNIWKGSWGVVLVVCLATQVFGDYISWNGGEGNWSVGANWAGDAEPTSNDVAYVNNGGTALCAAGEECGGLTLGNSDGQSGTVRLDDAADSLSNMGPGYVSLGLSGTGTLVQANGTFYSAKQMRLAYYASGYGEYVLSGGIAVLDTPCDLRIGNLGAGQVSQSGGLLELRGTSGRFYLNNGRYDLTGGRVLSQAPLTIGAVAGKAGRFVVDGPTAVLGFTNFPIVTIGNTAPGFLELKQGAIEGLGHLYIGNQDTGMVTQTGGTLELGPDRSLTIGKYSSGAGGNGTYELFGGTLTIGKSGFADRSIILAQDGKGTFSMGNATGCGILTQAVAGAGMVIGMGAPGDGTFQGWSDDGSGSRLHLTGPLYQNGRVIADGYGTDRALDFTGFDFKGNSIQNPTNGVRGWYAQNHGELILNTIKHFAIPKVHYWGESVGDTIPDMINSAYMVFSNNQGVVTGRLYAADHSAVHELGSTIAVSVHDFSAPTVSTYDLTIRYDYVAATNAGLVESDLKLYQWAGSAWADITSSLLTSNRLITATGLSSLGQFMIGATPRPPKGLVMVIQ